MAKRKRSRRGSRVSHSRSASAPKRKLGFVLGNLATSVVLLIVSVILYGIVSNEVLKNFFFMLALVFGVVGAAFLIIAVIFLILKILKR